jgi:hypothetical protein
MSVAETPDNQYLEAYEDFRDRRERLELASTRLANARTAVGRFIGTKILDYHARELYDSDQNLGMIEAMRAVQAGEPVEATLQEFKD